MADGQCMPSGLERPRYFDRQVVYADDLTLEQTHHDLQMRRLNRFLHGWGVVAGFDVSTLEKEGDQALVVQPGYALTPLGDEVYLPQPARIENVLALARAAGCDCGAPGCDEVDPEKRTELRGEGALGVKTIYLIVRPTTYSAGARPAAPEGCGHPGNHMQPSRWCAQVCLEIACKLEPPHSPQEIDCEAILAMVCAPALERQVPPMPDPIDTSRNHVVLAAIELIDKRIAGVSYLPRRTLLPVETLQDWLRCLCQAKPVEPPPVEPPPVEPPPVVPPPIVTPPIVSTPVEPTPVVSTPVVSTPVVSTPVEPTPVEPTPVEPTPVEPTPVEPTPVEPTPVEPTPVVSTPVVSTPVVSTPVVPTPVEPTPVQPTPVQPTPVVSRPVGPRPVISPAGRQTAGEGRVVVDTLASVPVEDVSGIGPTRAARLHAVGIGSAAELAALTPAEAAEALAVSEQTAARIVDDAKTVATRPR